MACHQLGRGSDPVRTNAWMVRRNSCCSHAVQMPVRMMVAHNVVQTKGYQYAAVQASQQCYASATINRFANSSFLQPATLLADS